MIANMRPLFGIPTLLLQTLAVIFVAPLLLAVALVAMQVADSRQQQAAAATRSAHMIAKTLPRIAANARSAWFEQLLGDRANPQLQGLRLEPIDGSDALAVGTAQGPSYAATTSTGATLRVFVQPVPTLGLWLRGMVVASVFALAVALGYFIAIRSTITSIDLSLDDALRVLDSIRQSNFNVTMRKNGHGRLRELEQSIVDTAGALDQARQQADEIVEKATDELQATLEEMEIKNVELDLARKRAVEEARAKAQFLANMSHEIRTPMNSIVGYAQLMSDSQLDAAQRGYARSITQSARTLLEIIEDILSLSRLEAGKLALVTQEFDVRALAAQSMEMLAPAAYGKNLQLRTLIDPAVPTFFVGDPLRIRQIMLNFMTNAVKFTHRGSVELRIGVKRQTRHNALLSFTVADTGRGIARRDRNRLFDAFTETSRGDGGGGTGLGLAIARSLTHAMDGRLSLDSQIDRGSSFSVQIPLKTDFDMRFGFLDALAGKRVRLAVTDAVLRDHLRAHFEICGLDVEMHENWHALTRSDAQDDACDFSVIDVAIDEVDALIAAPPTKVQRPFVLIASADNAVLQRVAEATGGDAVAAFSSATTIMARMARRLGQSVAQFEADETVDTLPAVDGARVLIADDDALGRAWLVELLTRHGVKVTACVDGSEAVEMARQARFDAIFLDARMPVCGGEQAARQIRSRSLNQATPLYALTASALSEDRKRFAAAGMDACLIKPASPKELLTLVAAAHTQAQGDRPRPSDVSRHDIQMNALLREELLNYRRDLRDHDIADDPSGLFDVAHRLHGAAAICQLTMLEEEAAHLEATARSGEFDERQRAIRIVLRRIDEILAAPATASTATG